MKIKRLLAMLMVLSITMCIFTMPSSAAKTTENEDTHIQVYFEDENVSEELKAKAIAHFTDSESEESAPAARGLVCAVIGHKIESTITTVITHKISATAPRCLERIYKYEACTRCDDYERETVLSTAYIYCCS